MASIDPMELIARLQAVEAELDKRREQWAPISYVVGDPYDTETNPQRRQENVRRLIGAMRMPWTDRCHRKWTTFSMLWLAVASVPACCDDYESAERQSVLWAERAAAMVKR